MLPAALGPLLVRTTVYTTGSPVSGRTSSTFMVTPKSAPMTLTTADALLFAVFVSPALMTLAVFVM